MIAGIPIPHQWMEIIAILCIVYFVATMVFKPVSESVRHHRAEQWQGEDTREI